MCVLDFLLSARRDVCARVLAVLHEIRVFRVVQFVIESPSIPIILRLGLHFDQQLRLGCSFTGFS